MKYEMGMCMKILLCYLIVSLWNISALAYSITNISENSTMSNEANIDFMASVGFLSSENCQLRSRRYISNGLCTSPKPIGEVVCAETCTMPSGIKSPFIFHLNSLRSRRKSSNRVFQQLNKPIKWKCMEASVRKKRVKLLCHDGTIRGYSLRLVTSCQCSPASTKSQLSKIDLH